VPLRFVKRWEFLRGRFIIRKGKNLQSLPRSYERVGVVFTKRHRKNKKDIGKKIECKARYEDDKMQIKEMIKSYAEKRKDILCVYLFGSIVSGKQNKFSDVDIAILFDDSVRQEEYSQSGLSLIDALSAVLDKNVDVVILNNANSFLKFRIIKTGIRVYERPNRGSRLFEARSVIEYFDFLPIREMLEKALINNIRRG